jgi:hypothetical protein
LVAGSENIPLISGQVKPSVGLDVMRNTKGCPPGDGPDRPENPVDWVRDGLVGRVRDLAYDVISSGKSRMARSNTHPRTLCTAAAFLKTGRLTAML